jgi:hypothetical protein
VRTSPPTRSNCPSWHASTHSSVGEGCLSALPSRCVLRSATHCGPTLSATLQRVRQGRHLKCLPQADASLRGPPARRCVPTQLQRRRDMRESVRDARRAAPRPQAGLGRHKTCDMWLQAGARGAPAPTRTRGTIASTARCCATCSSRCTRGGDAALPFYFRCGPCIPAAWAVSRLCGQLATRSVAVSRSSLACMDGCSPCAVVAGSLSWVPVRSRSRFDEALPVVR